MNSIWAESKEAKKLLPDKLREQFEVQGHPKSNNPKVLAVYVCPMTGWHYILWEGFAIMKSDWQGPGRFESGMMQRLTGCPKLRPEDMDSVTDYMFYGLVLGFEAEEGNVSLSHLISQFAGRTPKWACGAPDTLSNVLKHLGREPEMVARLEALEASADDRDKQPILAGTPEAQTKERRK